MIETERLFPFEAVRSICESGGRRRVEDSEEAVGGWGSGTGSQPQYSPLASPEFDHAKETNQRSM